MNKKNPPPFTFRPSPVRMIYQALISTKKKESNVKNVTKKEKKETPVSFTFHPSPVRMIRPAPISTKRKEITLKMLLKWDTTI